jgi:hypothetical protein
LNSSEEDGPSELGFTRVRKILVRKADEIRLAWSSPRVTDVGYTG